MNVPVMGRSVIFTGELDSMSRKDAQALIRGWGGKTPSGVSDTLDYLVVGDGGSLREGGQKNSKHKKVDALNMDGAGIRVMTETEFFGLKTDPKPETERPWYDPTGLPLGGLIIGKWGGRGAQVRMARLGGQDQMVAMATHEGLWQADHCLTANSIADGTCPGLWEAQEAADRSLLRLCLTEALADGILRRGVSYWLLNRTPGIPTGTKLSWTYAQYDEIMGLDATDRPWYLRVQYDEIMGVQADVEGLSPHQEYLHAVGEACRVAGCTECAPEVWTCEGCGVAEVEYHRECCPVMAENKRLVEHIMCVCTAAFTGGASICENRHGVYGSWCETCGGCRLCDTHPIDSDEAQEAASARKEAWEREQVGEREAFWATFKPSEDYSPLSRNEVSAIVNEVALGFSDTDLRREVGSRALRSAIRLIRGCQGISINSNDWDEFWMAEFGGPRPGLCYGFLSRADWRYRDLVRRWTRWMT